MLFFLIISFLISTPCTFAKEPVSITIYFTKNEQSTDLKTLIGKNEHYDDGSRILTFYNCQEQAQIVIDSHDHAAQKCLKLHTKFPTQITQEACITYEAALFFIKTSYYLMHLTKLELHADEVDTTYYKVNGIHEGGCH